MKEIPSLKTEAQAQKYSGFQKSTFFLTFVKLIILIRSHREIAQSVVQLDAPKSEITVGKHCFFKLLSL